MYISLIYNDLDSTGIRIGTLHCAIIIAILKTWKAKRPLGIKPATLRSKQSVICSSTCNRLFWPCFSGIPAPWCSCWVVGCVHKDLAVAFLEVWDEPDLHLAVHLPKQRRSTAWITARRLRTRQQIWAWSFKNHNSGTWKKLMGLHQH